MKVYLDRLKDIITNGFKKTSRTGVNTVAVFGRMVRYDLTDYKIPVITTKKIFLRSLIHETIWFISGSTRLKYLKQHGISIWDSWVKHGTAILDKDGVLLDGDIGEGSYGYMWRGIEDTRVIHEMEMLDYLDKGFREVMREGNLVTVTRKIDQLAKVIDLLRNDPDSRRIIINSFENRFVDFAALIACHCYVQFFSRELTLDERLEHYRKHLSVYPGRLLACTDYPIIDTSVNNFGDKLLNGLNRLGVPKRALSVMLVMRSNDAPVGEPFNMPQYALLAHQVAHATGHLAEELVYVNGDYHAYENQIELVEEQLTREPIEQTVTIKLNPNVKEIDDFTFDDIMVNGYENFHPSIKYPVAV